MTLPRLLPLFALAALLPAQAPILLGTTGEGQAPSEDPWISPTSRDWPVAVGRSGMIRKMIPGRISGHAMADVVMLDGTVPMIATAPGIHTSMGPLPTGNNPIGQVQDIAMLVARGFADGSHAGLDALAMVGSGGLHIWRRNSAVGTQMVQVGGSEWNTTQRIATHPLDSTRIYGVSSSGTVRMATLSANTYVTSTVTFPNCPSPLAIACIDWQGGAAGTEVAVLTTTGLSIFNSTGATLATFSASTSQGSLTLVKADTVGTPSTHAEWLAWLTPGTNSTLRICRNGGYYSMTLPGRFVGAAAGESSGDLAEDLLLSTEANTDVTLLCNIYPYAAQPFAYSPSVAARLAVASAAEVGGINNTIGVAAADFDADGDGDLIAAIDTGDSSTRFSFLRYRLYDAPSVVQLTAVTPTPDYTAGTMTLAVNFTEANVGTHTEVVVWEESWVGGVGTLVPMPLASLYGNQLVPRNGSGNNSVTIQVPISHLDNGGHFMLMMRPVITNQGQVVAVAEAFLGTITGPGGLTRAYAANGGSNVGFQGDIRISGIAPRPKLPPAPPGLPPQPK